MKGFVYIASPYSHINPTVRLERYREAVRFLRWCLAKRDWAYSPIAHTHDVQLGGRLKLSDPEWYAYSREMLSAAGALYVLTLDGWKESVGITEERKLAAQWGMLVTYFDKNSEDYVKWEPTGVETVDETEKSA